jgi:hypothetical protein
MIPTPLTSDTIREVLDRNGNFDVFIPIFFKATLESLLRTGGKAPGYTTGKLKDILYLLEAILIDREG